MAIRLPQARAPDHVAVRWLGMWQAAADTMLPAEATGGIGAFAFSLNRPGVRSNSLASEPARLAVSVTQKAKWSLPSR
jgi:hypothetical protein